MASPASAPPPRRRNLIFDRRYGWVFDEWRDPADDALSGGRGMFCILPVAQLLLNAAASSINFSANSVSRALWRSKDFSSPGKLSHLGLPREQQTWFHELKHSGLEADLKLIPCRTHCALDNVGSG